MVQEEFLSLSKITLLWLYSVTWNRPILDCQSQWWAAFSQDKKKQAASSPFLWVRAHRGGHRAMPVMAAAACTPVVPSGWGALSPSHRPWEVGCASGSSLSRRGWYPHHSVPKWRKELSARRSTQYAFRKSWLWLWSCFYLLFVREVWVCGDLRCPSPTWKSPWILAV